VLPPTTLSLYIFLHCNNFGWSIQYTRFHNHCGVRTPYYCRIWLRRWTIDTLITVGSTTGNNKMQHMWLYSWCCSFNYTILNLILYIWHFKRSQIKKLLTAKLQITSSVTNLMLTSSAFDIANHLKSDMRTLKLVNHLKWKSCQP